MEEFDPAGGYGDITEVEEYVQRAMDAHGGPHSLCEDCALDTIIDAVYAIEEANPDYLRDALISHLMDVWTIKVLDAREKEEEA